jgi:Arc/MetJ-type ribon-helix-helix transcriptional regulator
MDVQLSADQKAFARQAVRAGRLNREEEAVQEALALWESRERSRAEILVALDIAEASFASGEGRVITQHSMQELANQVNERGRARLAAEETSAG